MKLSIILCFVLALSLTVSLHAAACTFGKGILTPNPTTTVYENCLKKIPLNSAAMDDLLFFETMAGVYVFRDYLRNTSAINCNTENYKSNDYDIHTDIFDDLRVLKYKVSIGNITDFDFFSNLYQAFAKFRDAHTQVYFPTGYDFIYKIPFGLNVVLKNNKTQYLFVQRSFYSNNDTQKYDGQEIVKIAGMPIHEYLQSLTKHYCYYSMDHGACFNEVIRNDFETRRYLTPLGLEINGIDPQDTVTIEVVNAQTGAPIANATIPVFVYNRSGKDSTVEEYWQKYVNATKVAARTMYSQDLMIDKETDLGNKLNEAEIFSRASIFAKKQMIEKKLGRKINFSISQKFLDKISNKSMNMNQIAKEFARKNDKLKFNTRRSQKKRIGLSRGALSRYHNQIAQKKKARASLMKGFVNSKKKILTVEDVANLQKLAPRAAATYSIRPVASFVESDKAFVGFAILFINDVQTEIGFIEISSFSFYWENELPAFFQDGLNKLSAAGCKKVMIETRRNGGGSPVLAMSFAKQLRPQLPQLPKLYPAMDYIYPPKRAINDYDFSEQEYQNFNRSLGYQLYSAGVAAPNAQYVRLDDPNKAMNATDMLAGNAFSINYRKSLHSPLFTTGAFHPDLKSTLELTPSDIIIITDGSCGSACGAFLTVLQYTNNAKVVSLGGDYVKNWVSDIKSSVSTASFKGASVFEATMLSDLNEVMKINPLCTNCADISSSLKLKSNVGGRWSRYSKYAWEPRTLFRRDLYNATSCLNEFTKRDADFHLWVWEPAGRSLDTYFKAAEFFTKCASWEHKIVAYNNVTCGAFVQNGVYGQKCGNNGAFDTNSCELFTCNEGYFLDVDGTCKFAFTPVPKPDGPKPPKPPVDPTANANKIYSYSILIAISIITFFLMK